MIELLSALVANGTTAFDWGYTPWLPFYNFFPLIGLITFTIWYLGGSHGKRFASIFFVGTVWSLFPAYLGWLYGGLNPGEVFRTWAGCSLILIGGMGWVSQWKSHKFDSVKDYMEHIRTEHSDLWLEIQDKIEENKE